MLEMHVENLCMLNMHVEIYVGWICHMHVEIIVLGGFRVIFQV